MNTAGWTISIIAIVVVGVLAFRWERGSARDGSPDPRDDGTGPGSRYEFMSPSWIAMAKREITRALSARSLDVRPFTLSEEFTDPPRHLSAEGSTIGFFVKVGDGRVEVGDHPAPDADCRVISDYSDALAIARDPEAASADPAQAERRVASGKLRVEGDPSRMPVVLQQLDIHRMLARHTA